MIRWGIVGLVLLVGIAGCSAVPLGEPTPQEKPAPVMLVNNETQTEIFTVGVTREEASLTVHRCDGKVYNFSPGPGSGTHVLSRENPIIKIAFPESAQIHGKYMLDSGERKLINISNVAPNEAIVVLVYDREDGMYRSIKTLSCDGPILGYKITSQKGGPDHWTWSRHQCGY